MRQFAVPVLAALALCATACSRNPKDRLQGKWLGDSMTNVTPEQNAEVTAWVKGTSLEFAGDKMTVTVPAEQPRTTEFKVAKVDGNKVVLAWAREGGASEAARLVLAENDTLRLDVGEGREIALTRLK